MARLPGLSGGLNWSAPSAKLDVCQLLGRTWWAFLDILQLDLGNKKVTLLMELVGIMARHRAAVTHPSRETVAKYLFSMYL
jgi:hypothetical protein